MDLIAGRYRLAEPLGEGGGGTVWHAVDELLNREVAVKQLRIPPGLSESERAEFTGRAIQEARAAGRLSHPAIVMIHDVVDHGGQPWIVMDLVLGRSLDRLIRESGPLPVHRVAEIGLAVMDALETAHTHGILHRDVKPGNVLLGADGRVMLADFGIATSLASEDIDQHSSAGSPAYMAPERFRAEPTGPPSDLWSLGATLYAAAEGQGPFHRKLPAAVVAAVLLHEPPPMVRASPQLAWLVHAMLDKDPARRPSPEVVRQVLRAAAAPPPAHAAQPVRARRTLQWIVGGVLAVALGVGGGLGAWRLIPGRLVDDGPGRYAVAPDPCRGLTGNQVGELLGADARGEPSGTGCAWTERRSGRDETITLTYRVPASSQGEGGARVARLDFAGQRAARDAEPGATLRDQPGIADEAYAQDVFGPAAGTAGSTGTVRATATVRTTVWFRLSNLIVEVAYWRSGDAIVTPDDQKTAVHAAELVGAGLG